MYRLRQQTKNKIEESRLGAQMRAYREMNEPERAEEHRRMEREKNEQGKKTMKEEKVRMAENERMTENEREAVKEKIRNAKSLEDVWVINEQQREMMLRIQMRKEQEEKFKEEREEKKKQMRIRMIEEMEKREKEFDEERKKELIQEAERKEKVDKDEKDEMAKKMDMPEMKDVNWKKIMNKMLNIVEERPTDYITIVPNIECCLCPKKEEIPEIDAYEELLRLAKDHSNKTHKETNESAHNIVTIEGKWKNTERKKRWHFNIEEQARFRLIDSLIRAALPLPYQASDVVMIKELVWKVEEKIYDDANSVDEYSIEMFEKIGEVRKAVREVVDMKEMYALVDVLHRHTF